MDDEPQPQPAPVVPSVSAPPPPPPPPAPFGAAVPRTEGLVVAAFVVAIVGLFLGVCGILTGAIALVLANQAQAKIAASGGQLTGGGLLTAARIIAVISIVLSVAFAVFLYAK